MIASDTVLTNGRLITVAPERLVSLAAVMVETGHRVLTLVGTDERGEGNGFGLWLALLAPDGSVVQLRTSLDPADPRYPSLTRAVPAVHWDEREMADLLGLTPEGHPDPRRLVLREDWPADLFPLRKDFDVACLPPPSRHDAYPFTPFEGAGIGHVPVGPIHAGIIEPGHFRFAAVGEVVLELEARLFYTHRGIEKLVEGRSPEAALPVVERICAACAFSHALAFCEAVESLDQIALPLRAVWGRTLGLELERLYNHIGDSGNICAGTGFAVGVMQGARLKENTQRLIEEIVGHRFLRDVCAVGGLRRDFPRIALQKLRSELARRREETRQFAALLLGTDSFVDRLRGTGIVSRDLAVALGGVGVAARAAGVDVDARRDRPTAGYRRWPAKVVVQETGDVEARLRQRFAEIEESWNLIERLLADEPDGPVRVTPGPRPAHRVGLGVVESPRGADVHWLRTDAAGNIDRLRVRSASFANWPIVAAAAPGNLIPDFPLINKSFELCYACLDR